MQPLQPFQSFHPIDEIVVFGDSLSDIGNVYRTTGGTYPPNPPYFQGRYSNGRVWVEYLADDLKLTTAKINNFAFGGATVGNEFGLGIPDLLTQVKNFSSTQQKANPNALYTIWAGANDYLQGETNPDPVIATLHQTMQSLTAIGAQKILVANLPDLGSLPATRTTANAMALRSLTQKHNQELDKLVKQFKQQPNSNSQIIELDVYSLYHQAVVKPAQFGFTNVTGACLESDRACNNPDKFLFWDAIHPTAAAHKILGGQALSKLKQSTLLQPT